ncbi:MAG TPA: hypothetical protein VKS79_16470 [Gemmataceae bacterium]|nr:hypothetical protein [Gemmataceae bacterium]
MIQMKRLLVGAVAIVLTAGVVAIAEPPKPLPPQVAQPAPTGIYDPNVQQTHLIGPIPFGMEHCDTCEKYVCKLQTKEVKKPVYTSHCVPYCVPYCGHHNCADSCAECGMIAYKNVLVKKARIVCETKCVPVPAPCDACAPGVPCAPIAPHK